MLGDRRANGRGMPGRTWVTASSSSAQVIPYTSALIGSASGCGPGIPDAASRCWSRRLSDHPSIPRALITSSQSPRPRRPCPMPSSPVSRPLLRPDPGAARPSFAFIPFLLESPTAFEVLSHTDGRRRVLIFEARSRPAVCCPLLFTGNSMDWSKEGGSHEKNKM